VLNSTLKKEEGDYVDVEYDVKDEDEK